MADPMNAAAPPRVSPEFIHQVEKWALVHGVPVDDRPPPILEEIERCDVLCANHHLIVGAAGSAFVINVSNNFSLDNGSKIVLTGGLTFSDVLFNVRGPTGTFSIGGGSLFNGTLLAYNSTSSVQRTLTVSGANTVVTGETIANKVVISGAKMKKPPKKSKGGHDDDDDD